MLTSALLVIGFASGSGHSSHSRVSALTGPGTSARADLTPSSSQSAFVNPTESMAATSTVFPNISWTPIGPIRIPNASGPANARSSGKLQAIAIDPTNPSHIYVAGGDGPGNSGPQGEAGIWETENGGVTWTPVDNGLGNPTVNALWIDPANPSILLAGTWSGTAASGIFRTIDGGATWTDVFGSVTTAFSYTPSLLYAATGEGVAVSNDAGASWMVVESTDSPVRVLGYDGGTMYAGLDNGNVLINRSGAVGWTTTTPASGATVWSIAVDPGVPSTAFVVEWRDYQTPDLYETIDSGNSWSVVSNDLGAVQYVAFSPTNSSALFLGVDGALYTANISTTGTSSNSKLSFVKTNGTFSYRVNSPNGYVATPSSGSVVVDGANVTVGVAFSSVSTTATQGFPITVGLSATPGSQECGPPSINLNPPTTSGASVSINGGQAPGAGNCTLGEPMWDWGDGTTSTSYFPATHVYALPGTYTVRAEAVQSDGQTANASESVTVKFSVYRIIFDEEGLSPGTVWSVTISILPSYRQLPLSVDVRNIIPMTNGKLFVGSDQGFYESTNGGQRWVGLTANVTSSLLTAFAIAGNSIVTAVQDFSSISSFDGGSTWTMGTQSGPAGGEDGTVAISPGNPSYLYTDTTGGFLYSADGGRTYHEPLGLPTTPLDRAGQNDVIAFDPNDTSRMYLATGSDGIYLSKDAGVDWNATGWPLSQTTMVAVDPSSNTTIFVGTTEGLFLSHDGGVSWETLFLGSTYDWPPDAYPIALSVDPANSSIILVGLSCGPPLIRCEGLLRSTNGGQNFTSVSLPMPAGLQPSEFIGPFVNGLTFIPGTPWVVVATSGGIYASPNLGVDWYPLRGAAIPWAFTGVSYEDGSLYTSTYGEGILRAPFFPFDVTFTESGLPSGVSWSVTVGGSTISSTEGTITFSEPNGTYSYTLGSVSGYTGSPSSGSVAVAGQAQTIAMTFTAVAPGTFAVTFTETGLPVGIFWSMTLTDPNGFTEGQSTAGASIIFTESNGTYAYSVVSGYTASPSGGNVTVAGVAVSVAIGFSSVPPPGSYSVTFTETGLPPGPVWGVTLTDPNGNTELQSGANASIQFTRPNGTYAYSVLGPLIASPSGGNVTVAGAAVSVEIAFGGYSVTFIETGLPAVASGAPLWAVTFNGATVGSGLSTMGFIAANGSYSFSVGSVAGYTADPSSGTVTVNGANVTQVITFTAIPPGTYAVTFTETGLPVGAAWSITLNETTQSSAASTITFTEPNGTYSYMVGAVGGYTASPSSGTVTVNGAAVPESVAFTRVTYTATFLVTFTETGLPSGTSWSVTLAGVTKSSTATSIAFSEPNGSYSFTVGSLSGYTTSPSSGTLTVNGVAQSQSTTFSTNSTSPTSVSFPWIYVITGVVIAAAVAGVAIALVMRSRRH